MIARGAPLLQVNSLQVDYRRGSGWQRVLHDVNLHIGVGQMMGLVGESGSGKSTLAALLLGERRDDRRIAAGFISFCDVDLFSAPLSAVSRLRGAKIAYLPQNYGASLTPTMRVGAIFAETLRYHGPRSSSAARRETILALLRDVGLVDVETALTRYPHQFSGGQQQRIALALAISCRPRLLVLDEPTTGLDPIIRRSVVTMLRRLCRAHEMAMLFVSHDLATVAELCEAVAVMRAGQIVETGTVRQVFATPRHPYTRSLLEALPRLDRDDTQGSAAPASKGRNAIGRGVEMCDLGQVI
ncbi:ABC transporter ATP-binding protein [Labrys sp. 22185]|uniref:ABC transporter ATP-binding protein n=1 Tax=Labrys sp. 22185 TaxID=3453888 RepID=UPI003F87F97C